MLTPLNTRTAAIFHRLFTMADATENGATKLDAHNYSPEKGGIMPACVEHLAHMDTDDLEFYSVAHYYQQSGDAMRDPDVIFARHRTARHPKCPTGEGVPVIWPVSMRMDAPPMDDEAIAEFDRAGMPAQYRPRSFNGLWRFCNTWAANLKDQQRLDMKAPLPVAVFVNA